MKLFQLLLLSVFLLSFPAYATLDGDGDEDSRIIALSRKANVKIGALTEAAEQEATEAEGVIQWLKDTTKWLDDAADPRNPARKKDCPLLWIHPVVFRGAVFLIVGSVIRAIFWGT